jgi:aminopeptidase N
MLFSQTQKAVHMIDRYDALIELRNVAIEKKRNILIARFKAEKFHGIKAEIVSQLMYDENVSSKEIIKLAFTDKSADVRKAVIAKMPTIPLEFKTNYESFLQDSSYDIIASSLEKLCGEFPNEIDKYLALTKDVIGVRNRNVELKWLEMSLTQKGNQDLFNKLVNYTSNSYEFQTRINAIAVLKKFNYFDANLMDNCFDAMFNPNSRLAGPALDALKYFKAQYTFKQMIEERMATIAVEDYQKEIIKKNFY